MNEEEHAYDYTLKFRRGKIVDLTGCHDNEGRQLYNFAYFSTNSQITYLCLNLYELPKCCLKWGNKYIERVPVFFFNITKGLKYNPDYIFVEKNIKNIEVMLLVKYREISYDCSNILFVIRKDEFMDSLKYTTITENPKECDEFVFPAMYNNSTYLPEIDLKNTDSSPPMSPILRKFSTKTYNDNKTRILMRKSINSFPKIYSSSEIIRKPPVAEKPKKSIVIRPPEPQIKPTEYYIELMKDLQKQDNNSQPTFKKYNFDNSGDYEQTEIKIEPSFNLTPIAPKTAANTTSHIQISQQLRSTQNPIKPTTNSSQSRHSNKSKNKQTTSNSSDDDCIKTASLF